MTTLTSWTTVITPDQLLGFTASAEASTIVHDLLNGTTSYSLANDRPGGGELALLFADRTAAWAAYEALGAPAVWTLADPDVPEVNSMLVRDGSRTIELDDETRSVWTVTVGYRVTT